MLIALVTLLASASAAPAECADLQSEVVTLRARVKALEAEKAKSATRSETACAISVGDSPVLGKKDAKVQVVFFMDLQDPFSARVISLADDIAADPELKNKVAVVWKDFPLSFHANSKRAAVAGRAAHKAGGDKAFFAFAHRTFLVQKTLDDDKVFYQAAADANVPVHAFQDAFELDGPRFERAISGDIAAGTECHVRGTPSVFVNGWELDKRTVDGVKELIREKKL